MSLEASLTANIDRAVITAKRLWVLATSIVTKAAAVVAVVIVGLTYAVDNLDGLPSVTEPLGAVLAVLIGLQQVIRRVTPVPPEQRQLLPLPDPPAED